MQELLYASQEYQYVTTQADCLAHILHDHRFLILQLEVPKNYPFSFIFYLTLALSGARIHRKSAFEHVVRQLRTTIRSIRHGIIS